MNIIEGPYLTDLLEQPDMLRAVRATLESAGLNDTVTDGLRAGRFQRVVLCKNSVRCILNSTVTPSLPVC